MSELFSNDAGKQLLASLRQVFEQRRVYHRKTRFMMFVCGGRLGEGETSLRKEFIAWAEKDLPEFVSLIAEEALRTASLARVVALSISQNSNRFLLTLLIAS